MRFFSRGWSLTLLLHASGKLFLNEACFLRWALSVFEHAGARAGVLERQHRMLRANHFLNEAFPLRWA